jgi:hypothetical protein
MVASHGGENMVEVNAKMQRQFMEFFAGEW